MKITREFIKDNLTYHKVGKRHLFLIGCLPAWFVLSSEEAVVFHKWLFNGHLDAHEQDVAHRVERLLESRGLSPGREVTLLISPDIKNSLCNIHVTLTHKCNLRCRHCYLSAGDAMRDELTVDQWLLGFQQMSDWLKDAEITLSGGEATEKDGLSEIAKYLHGKCSKLTLFTNGICPLEKIECYFDTIQFSLEGLSPATNDFIRGAGTYERIIDEISKVSDKRKVVVALTIMAHNFEEIRRDLKNWLELNSLVRENVRLSAAIEPNGRATGLPNRFREFLYKNAESIYAFMHETKIDNKWAVQHKMFVNRRNCGIGLSIGIDANGDIYPCDEPVNCIGNLIGTKDFTSIVAAANRINKETEVQNINLCRTCDLKYVCLGGCKAKNMKANGSYLKPKCSPESKYLKYMQLAFDL